MNRACASLARALHTTPSRLRTARVKPSPAFSPSSSTSPPSTSRSHVKAHYAHGKFKPRASQAKNARGGPSSVTRDQLRRKLAQHLTAAWSANSPSIKLRALADDVGLDCKQLATYAKQFAKQALLSIDHPPTVDPAHSHSARPRTGIEWDWDALESSYISEGHDALWSASLSTFLSFVRQSIPRPPPAPASSTLSMLHQLAEIADNRFAYETYPSARQQRRKLIMHVGPTNSGKTYSALVALARARTGAYAGPLRLLAHEVFSRFNEGKIGNEPKRVCNLITGEEQRILDPEAGLISCTVEMFPMTRRLDVGVVDEIQMMGDPQRGSAWTQAVVGSLCDELHLCGEESVVGLVQRIAQEMGDECVVKRYERLSPLVVADYSLEGDLRKIRKGDCLVTFSRSNIFMFKRQIESKTGLKVAVAYGGLPPEVREEQARAFNAGEYDVLVASDAVGMGLNLKIRRIVFESLHKWDGTAEIRLPTPQIKQIAGRAGRYGVHTPISPSAPDLDLNPASAPNEPETVNGEATTLDAEDLPLLRAAMKEPTVQVTRASSTPPFDVFKHIYHLLPPSTRMSKIFELVRAVTRTKSHYRTTGTTSFGLVGDKIAHIHPLTFQERYTFGSAPVNLRDNQVVEALVWFVKSFAKGKPILMEEWGREVGLLDAIESVEEARQLKSAAARDPAKEGLAKTRLASVFSPTTLQSLESFHRCLTLYLWLSYRLAPIFSDQPRARELRQSVEKGIEFVLEGIRFERVERGKGSKRNKAKFSGGANEVDQSTKGIFDQFGRFKPSP